MPSLNQIQGPRKLLLIIIVLADGNSEGGF